MVQRQAIQLYRSAVAVGFRNPCFTSGSFMALSTRAFTPIQCSPLRISSLHVRSSSRVASAPLSSSRAHFLSGSRVAPCKEFLRRVERDYFIWPRASLGNGRLFSVWRRDGDAKDDTIVAGTGRNRARSGLILVKGDVEWLFKSVLHSSENNLWVYADHI